MEGADELLSKKWSGWSGVLSQLEHVRSKKSFKNDKSQKKVFSVFVHDFPFSLNEERFRIQTCQISDQGENQRYAKQTIKKRKYPFYGSLVRTAQKRVI